MSSPIQPPKTVAYLPESRQQSYQPPARGEWTASPASNLSKIAEDFVAPASQENPHSIPDVWKRPLIFADALCSAALKTEGKDELTPFEKQIRGEWRGALAILAFWGIRGWNWPKAGTVELVLPGADDQKLDFMKVLHKLQPDQARELLLSNVTWQRFHVLRGPTGEPFALTSPMSLVSTAEDCTGRLSGVPWQDVNPKTQKGFLIDPLVGGQLSSREQRWLAQWLAYLGAALRALGPHADRMQEILTELDRYERKANGGAQATPFGVVNLHVTGLSLFDPQNLKPGDQLYQLLDKPIGTAGQDSDVLVDQERSKDHQYYLIEPSLAHQWGRAARDIVVFGNRTLAEGVPDSKVSNGLLPQTTNCHWCTKDFFLEKRIVVFTEPGALPGMHKDVVVKGAGMRTPLPPLREEALRLFPAQDLAKRLSIEWAGDRIIARLQLDLKQATDAQARACVIERIYQGDDIQEVDGANVPVAKIWPNFTSPNWKIYHTYVALTGRELHMRPFPPAESAAARDYTAQEQGFAMYRTPGFPEALVCTLRLDSPGPQRPDQVCAVLPLAPPDGLKVNQGTSRSVVGVDFGSTGSIVFRKPEDGDPAEFTIQPRLYSATKESIANELRTDRDFLPNEARLSNDILSVFQVHGDPAGGDPARIPFCDGHILYLKTPEKFIDESTRNVKTNLKWGGRHETYLAGSFLEQLCLQTAAESLASGAMAIEWRFSYPTAFDRDTVDLFRKIWQNISDKVKKQTGVESTLAPEGANPEFCEAVCTARYFKAILKMNTTGGALSVDIGGGTSDYAFWRDETLTLHNSVLLAGRDIFLAALREKPKFLANLDKSLVRVVSDIERLRQTDRNAANAQIDAIIARKGDDLQLAMAFAHEEEAVKGFSRLVKIGISGILYYGGLQLRHQVEASANAFAPKDVFGIYPGGNGSKLFHWAFDQTFTEGSTAAIALGEVFKKASGLSVPIVIRLSEKPKSEVGYGLVAKLPTDRSLQIGNQMASFLTCESCFSGDKKYGSKESPTTAELRAQGLRIDPDLPEFTRFLTAIGCTLSAVERSDLVATVNNRLATLFSQTRQTQSDQDAEKVLPRGEPVWIIAFKAFLEDQIRAWARSV